VESLVGICVGRTAGMVAGMLGTLKAGCAYVPLDPNYPRERLRLTFEDSGAEALLTESALLGRLPETGARRLCLDEESDREWGGARDVGDDENPWVEVGWENLAYVIYTSGSTGRPKGVGITHRSASRLVFWAYENYEREDLEGTLASTSICFDLSVYEVFVPLGCGGKVILVENALALPEEETLLEVRLINTVPSAMAELVKAGAAPKRARIVNLAGEPLSAGLVEELYALGQVREVINLYGPTEDTTYSTIERVRRGEGRAPTIGRPIANTQAYALDERYQPVPIGVIGELYLSGEGLARGYLKRPELTAEKFISDPFSKEEGGRMYRSGDLARYLEDGRIEFLGRVDHQVKVRGFRIELGEIERALESHEGVREAVVMAREEVAGEKKLVGYVVSEGKEVEKEELRRRLGERLPEHMIPSWWVMMEEMPRTPNGKVDRRALPAPGGGRERIEEEGGPRTEAEVILAEIWKQVLGLERVGMDENFFHLGGDSILSIQIIARANQAGLRLTPKQLFQHQTIGELAAVAEAAPVRGEEGEVRGEAELTPIQRWFFEQRPAEPHHYNQSVMLEVKAGVEERLLEEVIREVWRRHDGLRVSFEGDGRGWRQVYGVVEEGLSLSRVDLTGLEEEEERAAIEEKAKELQRGLKLSGGPLAQAALYEKGEGKAWRLQLVIHHLVVDGVSWRILLEEMERGYGQLREGKELNLGPKTTSYKRWSERLMKYAQTEEALEELDYWLDEGRMKAKGLPVDFPLQ